MNWRSIAARATRETADDAEELLWSAGAVSVSVEDAGDNPLYEPGPGDTPLWEHVVVTGLFEDDVDAESVREQLAAGDFTLLHVDEVADREWERAWLDRFQPMRFGDALWVCPTGSEVNEPGAVVMHLDPGLAFGTGTHATTRLCLEWLDARIEGGERVIDFGCGSGILGIAALLLGAREVIAVDNDPQALAATRSNAERNGVLERLRIYSPEALRADPADVMVANILAQPLRDLASRLVDLTVPGGSIVLSGIMEAQVNWVRQAYPAVAFDEPALSDGWARLSGRTRQVT
ncbi:MAG: 50S ribosomal protein L11 methyltransferase [Pseudomonadales bacterium]|nr:50S ribosomal protein L11 methyltransferase [Pseudomonadales bacterium]